MSIQQLALLLLILLVGLACVFNAQNIQPFLTATAWSMENQSVIQATATSVSIPTTAPGNHTTAPVEHLPSSQNKYLQYFVSGGWSNQVTCLASAYAIAWATNRTLILSPVVPQGKLHFRTVFDIKRSHTFRLDSDLRQLYHGFHLRLDQVLDVAAWHPHIPTIHFDDFYQQIYPTLTNPQTWLMETNYSHLNSHWIFRQPELVGQTQYIEAHEYNLDLQYTIEGRDLEWLAQTFYHYDMWTLLDSYQALKHGHLPITFRPRFSSWIRQTAHQFIQGNFGDTTTASVPAAAASANDSASTILSPYYASVHIRGSDGPFKKPESIETAIRQSLDQITHSIVQWINTTTISAIPAGTHNTNTTDTNDATIGLFVATDIQSTLQSNPIFLQKIAALQQYLRPPFKHLKLVFGSDLLEYLQQQQQQQLSQSTTNNNGTGQSYVSFPFPDLKTPTIFLDQQIAACATIDFQGTNGSTFSDFIRQLRRNPSYSCAIVPQESQ